MNRRTLPVFLLLSAGLLTAETRKISSYKDLKYPPLRQVHIPEIATFTLPNGMKLYLLENHELPLVSGLALVRTGNLFDAKDKIGLATVTGMVMRTGGTKSKTGDQIDEQLENIAASVESHIGETNGRVSFSALKENTDEVLGIFRDLLTQPEFRQDKIDLAKTQLRSNISRRNDEPHGIVAREFTDILYGRDTPYGWRMEHEHVNRITQNDLTAFYKRYFFPANIMLAVQGDFSTPEMKTKLEKLFAGWNYTQPPVPRFPEVTAKPSPGVYLAEKKDVNQTFFQLGHLGGVLRDKDYPALEVMGDILGGGFHSRLFQKVRTQLGYVYHISAAWGAEFDHPGLFEISGSTKSASTLDAIRVIREEMDRIRTGDVSDNELEAAKQRVLNSFVFNFDTKSKTLSRLVTYEYYGYPKDFIFQYQRAVEAVTKADIRRVANTYLHPQEMATVVVGNPAEFGEPLAKLGLPVTPVDLAIPEPKAESSKADPASLERGKQLLRRMQQSAGGAEKLAAVTDLEQASELLLNQGSGQIKVKQLIKWVAPATFRRDADSPFGKMSIYSDGEGGWISSPQGAGPLPPPILKQIQEELFRNYFRLLLSDRDQSRSVNYAGQGILEISDKQGNLVKLTVDEKTGLLLKESYQQAGQMGSGPAAVEEIYADFQDTAGIKLPRKITINQNGSKFADITVQDYRLNSGLKVADLSKRP